MRKNNGVTLIALVITVIVLIILAAVTIFSETEDDGVITKAQESAEETDTAIDAEQDDIEATLDYIDESTANYIDNNTENNVIN